ncbi:MAG: hypothetical protein ND895_18935 [Pyrinomonadaceae bacterium]|nr:hypothetical protein [Pyrinomonadaceae bacterium]
MESHRALSKVTWVGSAAVVCLLTLAPNSVQCQQNPGPPATRDGFSEIRERQQREAVLRSNEMVGPAKKLDTRGLEEAAKQMREDFKGIQVMRNNVVRHLQSEKPLDYKLIATETDGIHRRANRLKAHLVVEPVEGEKKEADKHLELGDKQMKDALVTMCKRIDSFTENPTFKMLGVVDAEQSAKANQDLRDIIRLSGEIVKVAEKMKTPGK